MEQQIEKAKSVKGQDTNRPSLSTVWLCKARRVLKVPATCPKRPDSPKATQKGSEKGYKGLPETRIKSEHTDRQTDRQTCGEGLTPINGAQLQRLVYKRKHIMADL